MELKNKEVASPINIEDIQSRFKKIKNTVINLKKVNLFLLKFINIYIYTYRAMKHFFYL